MAQSIRQKFKDFSGYTSIHGIGRIGDSVFILRKLFWICALIGSLGMCIYQVYRLSIQYLSGGVNTKVSISYTELDFPSVSFCNLNPLSLSAVVNEPSLFQIINETANALGLQMNFPYQTVKDTYNLTYDPGNDPLETVKEVFRLRMGWFVNEEIYNMSTATAAFIVQCKYQGQFCKWSDLRQFRDEYYGTCYIYNPQNSKASLAGPSTGLELILNVHQYDYLPFLSDSSGARIVIHDKMYAPYMTGNGISVSTATETNIAISQKSIHRYAGTDGSRCDKENTHSGILVCMEDCIGQIIAEECGCLSSWTVKSMYAANICETSDEIRCMQSTKIWAVKQNAKSCSCKVPCSEIYYDKDISTTAYPAKNQQMLLEQLLNRNSANFGELRDSLVFVKVYFSSLTGERTEEELAYTDENFVSDIGGQLGLWVGMSVLSIAEVLEFVILVCYWCTTRRKDAKTDVAIYDTEKK